MFAKLKFKVWYFFKKNKITRDIANLIEKNVLQSPNKVVTLIQEDIDVINGDPRIPKTKVIYDE